MEIKSFDECMAEPHSGNKHLMLGNGFSVSLFPNIFNYSKLKEAASKNGLQPLFDKFNTNDYEFVMRKILDAKHVLSVLENEDKVLMQKLDDIYQKLSNTLIDTIANSHPDTPSSITEDQYKSCYNFLNKFGGGKIYTFNYDLLIYWVFMHFKDDPTVYFPCDDGFRLSTNDTDRIVWEIGAERSQSLYYIHGALHISSDNQVIEKYVWHEKTIVEQVRDNLACGKLPIFVCEGSCEHKKERIHSNGYLARSFASLKSIGGSLYIFGHSIRDEDDHVFELILNRNTSLRNIYIGIYGDFESDSNKKIITKVERWESEQKNLQEKKRKKITIFQSADVNVWNN